MEILAKHRKRIVLVICGFLIFVGFIQVIILMYGKIVSDDIVSDFVMYWASGRLLLTDNNPYSPEQLLVLQKSVGWTKNSPVQMYNPPWVIPFLLPFCMTNYAISKLFWMFTSIALVFFFADWCWRFYGGPKQHRWLGSIVAFTFAPTLFMLQMGQVVPMILLGVIGFLYFERLQKWYLAGSFIVLMAIKPHILYLFWFTLLFWALDRRRWAVMLGGILTITGTTIIAMCYDTDIMSHYFYTIANQPPTYYWATPTLGVLLRLLFNGNRLWLQYMPTILGILWIFLYWRTHRRNWEWGQRIPLILIVSMLTTPYLWPMDLPLLLPAIIQVAVALLQRQQYRAINQAIIIYLLINGIALVMHILRFSYYLLFWMVPAILLYYLFIRRKIVLEHESN